MSNLKQMRSKFNGTCAGCGCSIRKGEKIAWSRETGAFHKHCVPSGDPKSDQEYYQGRREGERYSQERKIYGNELAEQFAMEDEFNRYWKHGEDY